MIYCMYSFVCNKSHDTLTRSAPCAHFVLRIQIASRPSNRLFEGGTEYKTSTRQTYSCRISNDVLRLRVYGVMMRTRTGNDLCSVVTWTLRVMNHSAVRPSDV